jgi:hypothetical protein
MKLFLKEVVRGHLKKRKKIAGMLSIKRPNN